MEPFKREGNLTIRYVHIKWEESRWRYWYEKQRRVMKKHL